MPRSVTTAVGSGGVAPSPRHLVGRWWFWAILVVGLAVALVWVAGAAVQDGAKSVPWWDQSWHFITQHPLHYLSQHGSNVVIGLGAGATFFAVLGGAYLAFRYGRKGSASVSATVYSTPLGFVVVARPCMKAVGLFPVKFSERGAFVRMDEVYVENNELKAGGHWFIHDIFGQEDVKQYADAGEELFTSAVFPPVTAAPTVIGWMVQLRFAATNSTPLLRRFQTGRWADQAFVAKPDTAPPLVRVIATNGEASSWMEKGPSPRRGKRGVIWM